METEVNDTELIARLRRLDAGSSESAPGYDYQGMLARREARDARARHRSVFARGSALALVVALVGASVWRLGVDEQQKIVREETTAAPVHEAEPRIVRADTYLAVAALEDHIASIDDALNVARAYSPRGEEVARLERTRAELLDSYAQVRYAELVSANF
ncbi:MAG TPA: hypothetical protein VFZ95_05395 [Steroidobacteraceae bacterium]